MDATTDLHSEHIELLGKSYSVKVKPEELAPLRVAAQYLDKVMHDLQEGGNVVSHDRIAILAALNIANDFLNLQKQMNVANSKTGEKLGNLLAKLSSTLTIE